MSDKKLMADIDNSVKPHDFLQQTNKIPLSVSFLDIDVSSL
jgi:hypothetical protein